MPSVFVMRLLAKVQAFCDHFDDRTYTPQLVSTGASNLLSGNDATGDTGVGSWIRDPAATFNSTRVTLNTGSQRTGAGCIRLDNNNGSGSARMFLPSGLFAASPGDYHWFSCWGKDQDNNWNRNVGLEYLDSSGAVLATAQTVYPNNSANVFRQLSHWNTAAAPAGTAWVRPFVGFGASTGGYYTMVDDIELRTAVVGQAAPLGSPWVVASGAWQVRAGKAETIAVSGGTPPFGTGSAFARYPVGIGGIDLSVDLTHIRPLIADTMTRANGTSVRANRSDGGLWSFGGSTDFAINGNRMVRTIDGLPSATTAWMYASYGVATGVVTATFTFASGSGLVNHFFWLAANSSLTNGIELQYDQGWPLLRLKNLATGANIAVNSTTVPNWGDGVARTWQVSYDYATGAITVKVNGTTYLTGTLAGLTGTIFGALPTRSFTTNGTYLDNVFVTDNVAVGSGDSSLVFAYDPTSDTGFSVDYDGGTTISLVQHNGAAATTLATATVTAFTSASLNVVYDDVAGTIEVLLDNAPIINVDLSLFTLAATDAFAVADTANYSTGWSTDFWGSMSSAQWGVDSGKLYLHSTSSVTADPVIFYRTALDGVSADFDISVDQWPMASGAGPQYGWLLAARWNPANKSHWYLTYSDVGFRNADGSTATAASLSSTFAAGDRARFVGVGNTLTVYKNGAQVAQITSSLNNTMTRHGILNNPQASAYSTGGATGIIHARTYDNYSQAYVSPQPKMTGTWAGLMTDTALADAWDEFCWTLPTRAATPTTSPVRVSALAAQALIKNAADLRVSAVAAQALIANTADLRVSAVAAQVLITN